MRVEKVNRRGLNRKSPENPPASHYYAISPAGYYDEYFDGLLRRRVGIKSPESRPSKDLLLGSQSLVPITSSCS